MIQRLLFTSFRFFSLPHEERQRQGLLDPMCELFPKQVGCYYARYGMGGGRDSRHAMCVLGHNMVNDKVFLLVWIWYCFLVTIGCIRVSTRSSQVCSSKIRYFLVKMRMDKYFRRNAHIKHIKHYILNCSIGDWFVLYQMSKNLNKRYFAEFLSILAMTVDPDPNIVPEEPVIHLSPEDIEKIKSSSTSSGDEKIDEYEDGQDEDVTGDKKSSVFSRMGGEYELDTSLGPVQV